MAHTCLNSAPRLTWTNLIACLHDVRSIVYPNAVVRQSLPSSPELHSKAHLKSTKFTYSVACHSKDCSTMFFRVNICSLVPLPDLKPACSFLNRLSMPAFNLCFRILLKILLVTDSNVMPLQFSQYDRSPFLGTLTIAPCVHSWGTTSLSHISLNNTTARWWSFPGLPSEVRQIDCLSQLLCCPGLSSELLLSQNA